MKTVKIAAEALRKSRGETVRRLLTPLLTTPHQTQVRQIGFGRDFTLGALPIGMPPSPAINGDEPRVPTKIPRLFFNYYETWKIGDSGDVYLLDKSYLHIHLQKALESRQILSLHCDPCIPPSEQHYRYKRGPHLHIEGANPNVDRAHISLCLHDSRLGGETLDELTAMLRQAVIMIEKEMFPCWERTARN